jgi:predicted transcriptional regulator
MESASVVEEAALAEGLDQASAGELMESASVVEEAALAEGLDQALAGELMELISAVEDVGLAEALAETPAQASALADKNMMYQFQGVELPSAKKKIATIT